MGHELIPVVDYLDLSRGTPRLTAHECRGCGARYFGRRIRCANCTADRFELVDLPTTGRVVAYTVVHVAAPHVPVPFVPVVVEAAGTHVRGSMSREAGEVVVPRIGDEVDLVTYSLGPDSSGREAIAFAFAPSRAESND